jgi:acetamidase/formamidase
MPASEPDHRLPADDANVHYTWDRDHEPVLAVESGDVVAFECRDVADGQLPRDATAADVEALEIEGHALTGPVAVRGVQPGDALAVDVLAVDHRGIGWTYHYSPGSGAGLLSDAVDGVGVHVWELDGDVGRFVDGIEVPLDPFPGVVGLAPAEPGPHSTTPPRRVGGNLDVKHLTAGSTLYLPIAVEGGLLSIGDGHAAQGDGEVCVTGIEAPLDVTVRVRLADRAVDGPVFETDGPFEPAGSRDVVGVAGVAPAPETAAREAVRSMVDRLHEERGLSTGDAYMLCSVAADLKINEAVNENWVVSAYLPAAVLSG